MAYAHSQECDGIICGHVHTPKVQQVGDTLYLNIGDWMESCTALVEDNAGHFRHVQIAPQRARMHEPRPGEKRLAGKIREEPVPC